MVICLRHVVKLVETLFDSGSHLVVLGRFHCSQRRDVRTAGMDFNIHLSLKTINARQGSTISASGNETIP
jgi:hypothetical protein